MSNQFYTPFGPLLMRGVLSDNVFDILLRTSNSTRHNMDRDFRSHLAGNIAEGYALKFTSPEQNIVHNEFINLAKEYMTESKKLRKIKKFGRPKIQDLQIVDPIWVNFMKPGEWNPSHFHAGIISCVAYLKVPKEITQENSEAEHCKESNQPSAGKIQWTYGESIHFSETYFNQIPAEKDVWLFPADLKHMVYPFKSQVERVSISCNFK